MSRQRFIYPEIWHSEQIMAVSLEQRLLFIGMFSTADDKGRRKASPLSLKVDIFPMDDLGLDAIRSWRDALAQAGLIRIYWSHLAAEGREAPAELLDIPTWEKFQRPKYKKDSKFPPYADDLRINPGQIGPDRDRTRATLDETRQSDASGVVWCGSGSGVDVEDAYASSSPGVVVEDRSGNGPEKATARTAHVCADGNGNGEKPFEAPPLPKRALEILDDFEKQASGFRLWTVVKETIRLKSDHRWVLEHLIDLHDYTPDKDIPDKLRLLYNRLFPKNGNLVTPCEDAIRDAGRAMNEETEAAVSELPPIDIGSAAKKGKPAASKKKGKKT